MKSILCKIALVMGLCFVMPTFDAVAQEAAAPAGETTTLSVEDAAKENTKGGKCR